ncbi:Rap1a/Tai family immunity protein [Rhizobium sp. SYY.PMSO]|uniref:Rap1a/Tai family immunity protein n=1 Tax=Rhizobium sp. SYY.PMSO TaxID=3382192 RepID=UPI00398FA438
MKLSLSVAVLLLLLPQAALSEEALLETTPIIGHVVTGKQLDEWCKEDRTLASVYIQGILDEAQRTKNLTIRATKQTPKNSSRYERYLQQFVGAFCLPPDLSNAKATAIACKWMSEHSWQLERSASSLIARSYKFAFPCLEE